ncbi:LOW QUALITY PROTEIN: hypothetical protein BRADI_1g57885v3 [Brachypodium distachyon]|uniref:Uncharacterized protein n=1 Tax=Brachypodium distachyon TaxID=15368 RepID=A0A2K2DS52_BRADI|nr:LOW QUALITY PROTEIN: hypothetical protein BRADI_1g57885v3 [Brachypodium distachyon]
MKSWPSPSFPVDANTGISAAPPHFAPPPSANSPVSPSPPFSVDAKTRVFHRRCCRPPHSSCEDRRKRPRGLGGRRRRAVRREECGGALREGRRGRRRGLGGDGGLGWVDGGAGWEETAAWAGGRRRGLGEDGGLGGADGGAGWEETAAWAGGRRRGLGEDGGLGGADGGAGWEETAACLKNVAARCEKGVEAGWRRERAEAELGRGCRREESGGRRRSAEESNWYVSVVLTTTSTVKDPLAFSQANSSATAALKLLTRPRSTGRTVRCLRALCVKLLGSDGVPPPSLPSLVVPFL